MKLKKTIPPKLAQRFLALFLRDDLAEEVQGDLDEQFYSKVEDTSLFRARLNYWYQVINYLRPFAIGKSSPIFLMNYAMYRNYIKISWRNLMVNKWSSVINIGGLATGIAIFFLLSLFSRHELSYDKFHKNYENIHQVQIGGGFETTASLATELKENIIDSDKIVRIDDSYGGGQSALIIVGEDKSQKKIRLNDVLFADDNLFDLFNFQVLYGNPATALKEPYSIVLSSKTSQLLFGLENSVGKSIQYIGDRSHLPAMDMTVTAIIENPPSNSSITFNAISSFSTLYAINPTGRNLDEDWVNWGYKTYVLLNSQRVNAFQENLSELWKQKEQLLWPDEEEAEIGIVHLGEAPFYNNNKRSLIILIQLLGVFILIIAIINFVNLTVAKSASRSKEIGIRKVVGSPRFQIIKQFLFESVFTSLLVAPVALIIIQLIKPQFYLIINKQIPLDLSQQPLLIVYFVVSIFIIGLISGIYPALFMSSFKPAAILKGAVSKGKKRASFRFGLFVFQFVVSVSLIICTVLISNQIEFFKGNPLGFNSTNIIHSNQSQQINEKFEVFKQKLLQNPKIASISRSNGSLGQELNMTLSYDLNGVKKEFQATTVDPDFISTMGIPLVDGRDFSWDIQSDKNGAILVNETFVREFELQTTIGTEIGLFDFLPTKPKIIGIVKDFHNNSFHKKIEPSVFWYADWNSRINIKIREENIGQSIAYIEKVWNELSTQIPFEYEFLDSTYSNLYKSEEQLQKIFSYSTIVAIVLACLGLFGLISESAEQRTKEIGVRKVLGSSIIDLIRLLTQDYIKWIMVASLVAWPISYFIINSWIQNFEYRIDISVWPFLLSGLVVLVISLFTISFHAIKTALKNPVHSLRSE